MTPLERRLMADVQDIPWYLQVLGQLTVILPTVLWAGRKAVDERVDARVAPLEATLVAIREDLAYIRGRFAERDNDR
jgi:hypothetical protein